MAIPYVAAIIERTYLGIPQILIQTRWKPEKDPLYSGTLEFPAGTLDRPYENIYDALAREIDEECGLKLKSILDPANTKLFCTPREDAVFGFRPFCCTQQLKNGKPWVGFVFLCTVEDTPPKTHSDESKEIRWVATQEIKRLFETHPEQFFTLQLPTWDYYFKERAAQSDGGLR